jgi:hypothetical protein
MPPLRQPTTNRRKRPDRFIPRVFEMLLMLVAVFGHLNTTWAASIDDCFACFDNTTSNPGANVIGKFPLLDIPFQCNSELIDQSRNFSGDAIFLTPGSVLWPGGIYSSSTIAEARPGEIVADRNPLTVSVTLNVRTSSKLVEKPSRSTVQAAINEMLGTSDSNTVNPLQISFEYQKYDSAGQTALDLGIFGSADSWSGSAGFNRVRAKDEHSIMLKVFQTYYTVNVDQPKSPADLFPSEVACLDLQKQFRGTLDTPVIALSSVVGRMILYELSWSSSSNVTSADADIVGTFKNFLVSANGSSTASNTLSKLAIRAFALGGPPSGGGRLVDPEGARELYQAGLTWSLQSPGFPLVFSFHCLTPGFPSFGFSKSTTYVARNCTGNKGSGAWKTYMFGWDNGHNNVYTLLPDGSPHSPAGLPGTASSPWGVPVIQANGQGTLNWNYGQDYNCLAEAWLFVSSDRTIPFAWSADTGFIYLDGAAISGSTTALFLKQGLHLLRLTGYNQNQGSHIRVDTQLQTLVDWMNHEPPGPVLASSQDRIDVSLPEGSSAESSLFVGNQGTGSLGYKILSTVPWIKVEPSSGSVPEGGAAQRHVVTIDGTKLLHGLREGYIKVMAEPYDQVSSQALVVALAADVEAPEVWMDESPVTVNPGESFTISLHRSGVISSPLAVQLAIGGILESSDFVFLPRFALFPPGSSDVTVRFDLATGEGSKFGAIGFVPSQNYAIRKTGGLIGAASVTILAGPPLLKFSRTGAGVRLSWDGSATLEWVEPLTGSWKVYRTGGSPTVVPFDGLSSFFRLRR